MSQSLLDIVMSPWCEEMREARRKILFDAWRCTTRTEKIS